jgi:hypothetical protein
MKMIDEERKAVGRKKYRMARFHKVARPFVYVPVDVVTYIFVSQVSLGSTIPNH